MKEGKKKRLHHFSAPILSLHTHKGTSASTQIVLIKKITLGLYYHHGNAITFFEIEDRNQKENSSEAINR